MPDTIVHLEGLPDHITGRASTCQSPTEGVLSGEKRRRVQARRRPTGGRRPQRRVGRGPAHGLGGGKRRRRLLTIYRTTDGGASGEGHPAGDYTVGISAVNASEAWGVRNSYQGTIYHTTDGGRNWTQTSQLDGRNLPGLSSIAFALQPVPEPSSRALATAGLAAVLLARRRSGRS